MVSILTVVIAVALAFGFGLAFGILHGFRLGTQDTERRWAESVARKEEADRLWSRRNASPSPYLRNKSTISSGN